MSAFLKHTFEGEYFSQDFSAESVSINCRNAFLLPGLDEKCNDDEIEECDGLEQKQKKNESKFYFILFFILFNRQRLTMHDSLTCQSGKLMRAQSEKDHQNSS